mgnify:CR=1 FL=1
MGLWVVVLVALLAEVLAPYAPTIGDLRALRDDVAMVEGNDVAVRRTIAMLRDTDTVIALDLRRYDKWVVDAAKDAHERGVWLAAVTDSLLSPLAEVASEDGMPLLASEYAPAKLLA